MPLHDVGYRGWQGNKASAGLRWMAIALTGIQVAFRSSWLGRTLILAWVPAIAIGALFLLYEQSITQPEMRQMGGRMLQMAGASPQLAAAALSNPAESRHEVWAALLMGFFRYPQAVLMVIIVGIVAPRLISFDLRNRGYLLYFSKPISIAEYIFGKVLVLWAFLAMVTTLPALVLYGVGLALASDLGVFMDTWDLPLRILLSSVVLMLPTAAVALLCSAMTIESRYAAFAWFAIWIIGWVTYSVLSAGEFADQMRSVRGSDEMPALMGFYSRWEIVSPYHLLGRVQQWVFGLFPAERSILPSLGVLGGVTILSFSLVYRQIRTRLMT